MKDSVERQKNDSINFPVYLGVLKSCDPTQSSMAFCTLSVKGQCDANVFFSA